MGPGELVIAGFHMNRFAFVKNGKVEAIFDTESLASAFPDLNLISAGSNVQCGWIYNSQTQEFSSNAPSTAEKDLLKYLKRAEAKNKIIAWVAQENVARVKNGTWTTEQLISLTQDAELKDLLDDVNSLSFEIAANKITGLTNELLTSDIKAAWIEKLQGYFY